MPIPVLENVYARVDILDYDHGGNTFSVASSIYFLGEASKFVSSVGDITASNKGLVSAIGASTANALRRTEAARGGATWEELDDDDFEALLNSADVSVPTVRAKATEGVVFSSLLLYSKDKASDVRSKIAIEAGIAPYKQHLWLPAARKTITGDGLSLMTHYTTAARMVEGFPIDARPPPPPQTVNPALESLVTGDAVVIECVSLDSIVASKSRLQLVASSNSELFEEIYANAIHRFFPLVSYSVLGQYMQDESKVDYHFDRRDALERFQTQATVLPLLNSERQVTIDSADLLTASTSSITLIASQPDHQLRIDTLKLFNSADITSMRDAGFIDVYSTDANRRPVRLRKLEQRDLFRKISALSHMGSLPVSAKDLMYGRFLIVSFLPTDSYVELLLMINQFGSVWVKAQPNPTLGFTKAAFIAFVGPILNQCITKLNTFEGSFCKLPLLPLFSDISYKVLSSSTILTFKFHVSYSKLVDLLSSQLLGSGFVDVSTNERLLGHKMTMGYTVRYGVSQDVGSQVPEIEVKNVGEAVVIGLYNLDIVETALYIDLIGRMVVAAGSSVRLEASTAKNLGLVDPVLFRPSTSSDSYSRICQKKFQPVMSKAGDKSATEYYNFTFQRPEYYSCPSKDLPVLGLIQGKHELGYCLPCCRKKRQPDGENVRRQCIANTAPQDKDVNITYKLDYPIASIPNTKIMNRRIKLPRYVLQLFGVQSLVANGSIMTCHGGIRDCTKPMTKTWMQTATMVAAVDQRFGSMREFVLTLIEMLKQPLFHLRVMKHSLVSRNFTTPQALVHLLEDYFIKGSITLNASGISSVDINDLVVYLSNVMGMNVLLLADDRDGSSIKLCNLASVDTSKPVAVLLKRLDVEWSQSHSNTRALYLPVTTSAFKVYFKSRLELERLNLQSTLAKIKRVTSQAEETLMAKQLTVDRLTAFANASGAKYSIQEDMSDQKLVVVGVGAATLLTSVSTPAITMKAKPIAVRPSASIGDALRFIADYNSFVVGSTVGAKSILDSYAKYLRIALSSQGRYELVSVGAFLLKVVSLTKHSDHVIGLVVAVCDDRNRVATKLAFCKETAEQSARDEVGKFRVGASADARSVLTSPLDQELQSVVPCVNWDVSPLDDANSQSCKTDLKSSFTMGIYLNGIYSLFAIAIADAWKQARCKPLDDLVQKFLHSTDSSPRLDTQIDTFFNEAEQQLKSLDMGVVRSILQPILANAKVDTSTALSGIELKCLHRLPRDEVRAKVSAFAAEVAEKTAAYPTFDVTAPASNQRECFFDPKSRKLRVHASIYDDMVDLLVADLSNPFRRDYIINLQRSMSALEDERPHIGELIFVQDFAAL